MAYSIKMLEVLCLMDSFIIEDSEQKPPPKPDAMTRAAIWAKYKSQMLKLPTEYVTKQEDFQRILDSPLLPRALVDLIDAYQTIVLENLKILQDLLDRKCERDAD